MIFRHIIRHLKKGGITGSLILIFVIFQTSTQLYGNNAKDFSLTNEGASFTQYSGVRLVPGLLPVTFQNNWKSSAVSNTVTDKNKRLKGSNDKYLPLNLSSVYDIELYYLHGDNNAGSIVLKSYQDFTDVPFLVRNGLKIYSLARTAQNSFFTVDLFCSVRHIKK